jgi:hypothetical protein
LETEAERRDETERAAYTYYGTRAYEELPDVDGKRAANETDANRARAEPHRPTVANEPLQRAHRS